MWPVSLFSSFWHWLPLFLQTNHLIYSSFLVLGPYFIYWNYNLSHVLVECHQICSPMWGFFPTELFQMKLAFLLVPHSPWVMINPSVISTKKSHLQDMAKENRPSAEHPWTPQDLWTQSIQSQVNQSLVGCQLLPDSNTLELSQTGAGWGNVNTTRQTTMFMVDDKQCFQIILPRLMFMRVAVGFISPSSFFPISLWVSGVRFTTSITKSDCCSKSSIFSQ